VAQTFFTNVTYSLVSTYKNHLSNSGITSITGFAISYNNDSSIKEVFAKQKFRGVRLWLTNLLCCDIRSSAISITQSSEYRMKIQIFLIAAWHNLYILQCYNVFLSIAHLKVFWEPESHRRTYASVPC